MNLNKNKGYKGKGMDGFLARFYDKNARNHIMTQYKIWTQTLLEIIPKDAHLLEVAPGPGYLAIELAKSGIKSISGIDISPSFVEIAKNNAKESNVKIAFISGNVSMMPFENDKFSHIICTSAFKNFSQPLEALNEIYRVLKIDGLFWMSDMRHDITDHVINRYVDNEMCLKGFNNISTKMTFKYMLRKRAYSKESFIELLAHTEFKVIDVKETEMELICLLKK
jgi:ubiquinone/menaquinone biosynthesis C-methylase UbiE